MKVLIVFPGLPGIVLGIVVYYFALIHHNILFYALAFILLALSCLLVRVKRIYMYSTEFVEWYCSLVDKFVVFVKIVMAVLAVLTLVAHMDLLGLFVMLSVLLPVVLSHWVPEGVIAPSILIAVGIVCIVGIYTHEPIAKVNPLFLKTSSWLLSLILVIPPALYIVRKYREAQGKPFMTVTDIVAVALLLLGLGVLALFPIAPFPVNYIVSLGWGSVITITSLYTLIKRLRGEYWSTAIYYGDYMEEAKDKVIELLNSINAKYTVKYKKHPPQYEINVTQPFKAKITVRKWIHRAVIRTPDFAIPTKVGEPGLVIEVHPGPKKAPQQLKEIMVKLLEYLNLSTIDWKQE